MMKKHVACIPMAAFACIIGGTVFLTQAAAGQGPPSTPARPMSFFVTSVGVGEGANLGGLGAADYHCQQLAKAVGSSKTFYAYLSTRPANGTTTLNARDRIGTGPWYNAKGVLVAQSVADLHAEGKAFTRELALTEKGEMVNNHDILTGSKPDGTAYTDGMDHTCNVYTSSGRDSMHVGHSDGAADKDGGTSWNSAHATGCSQASFAGGGTAGRFYCFSID